MAWRGRYGNGRRKAAAERIFGYKAHELVGHSVNLLMPEPYRSEHDEYMKRYLKTRQAKIIGFDREVVGLRKNGSTFPLDLGVSEMNLNERTRFVGAVRDKTGQKRAEERIQVLSAAVEQSPDSVMITDPNGIIEYVNPCFTKTAGYSLAEVIGANPSIIKSGKHPQDFYKNLWDTILSGNTWQGDFCNKKKNGELYWELQSIVPLKNQEGDITHFVSVTVDDTQRRKAEEKLKRYASELKRSNQDLQDFASIASHDLQEPLRKIAFFGDRLQEQYSDALDVAGKGYVERMQNATVRMKQFIDDLLELSKVNVRSQPFEFTNFADVVAEVLIDLKMRIKETQGRVEINPLPTLMVDKFQMRQLFQNLIANALKFHRKEASPIITIKSRL